MGPQAEEEDAAYEALLTLPPRTAAELRAFMAHAAENERVLESIELFLRLWIASEALNGPAPLSDA